MLLTPWRFVTSHHRHCEAALHVGEATLDQGRAADARGPSTIHSGESFAVPSALVSARDVHRSSHSAQLIETDQRSRSCCLPRAARHAQLQNVAGSYNGLAYRSTCGATPAPSSVHAQADPLLPWDKSSGRADQRLPQKLGFVSDEDLLARLGLTAFAEDLYGAAVRPSQGEAAGVANSYYRDRSVASRCVELLQAELDCSVWVGDVLEVLPGGVAEEPGGVHGEQVFQARDAPAGAADVGAGVDLRGCPGSRGSWVWRSPA